MKVLLVFFISYLVGSIPTAYLFGKYLKGIDIREHGSGNMGATNAFRVLGKKPGVIVLLIDIFKGVAPFIIFSPFFQEKDVFILLLMAIFVVAGHNWPVFLQFKGGKGIATSLGALIGLALKIIVLRWVLPIVLLIWLVVFLASGYVSLASMSAALVLPIFVLCTDQPSILLLFCSLLCLSIFIRHRPNIKKLLGGTESRVKFPFLKKK